MDIPLHARIPKVVRSFNTPKQAPPLSHSLPFAMATSANAFLAAPLPRLLPLYHSRTLGLGLVHPRPPKADVPAIPSFLRGSAIGMSRSSPAFGIIPKASADFSGASGSVKDAVPMPIVLIDQDSDSDATIVQLSFGDRLGALIDTMKALKDLGLDVTKGTVATDDSVLQTRFFITRLGRKLENPDLLERVRLTIINNLLKYHPESSELLAMGEAFGIKAPPKPDVDIATHIHVEDDGPKRSLLYIETADRPGLLLEIIKIISDTNISVESAEIDTKGLIAKDKFHVSYRGAALNSSLSQVLTNCLRYYLRRPETEEDSY